MLKNHKCTNNDLIELFGVITELEKSSENEVDFSYGLGKNIRNIEPEVKTIQGSLKSSDDYKKYGEEHNKLLKKYADKDDKGKTISFNHQGRVAYQLDENNSEYIKEYDKLKEEYKLAIEENDVKVKNFEELLERECEINLYTISIHSFPKSIKRMSVMIPLIREDEEEIEKYFKKLREEKKEEGKKAKEVSSK